MLWLLEYEATQLSGNWNSTYPIPDPIVWLITFQQPHLKGRHNEDAEGRYKCTV